ncbi:nucleoside deaminase [Zooshikella harenae]|uniref:Nucleoside deaminase n=1 Tax=Zooshikella harenae TaxID=2827238 RepID=A0ABS5ZJS2_9GAMM|nr:nucleoside deaminase [Zooshikella harenae]MBU2714185.1 nucleoside deaminase [Zooshikella harenae]
MNTTDPFLSAAIEEAEQGREEGGIPIGSVLVHQQKIIGRGHNQRVQQKSAVLHAEMHALEEAGRLPASVYEQCTLYTTLSPCAMCSGAIILYGIPHVVVGENKTFMGQEQWLRDHGVKVDVIQDERCVAIMNSFIATHPELWNEDIGE